MRVQQSVLVGRSSMVGRAAARVRLGLAMTVMVVGSLLLPGTPASAAVVVKTTGTIGTWKGDTASFVLFTCHREPSPFKDGGYDYNANLVTSPAIYARDRTAGTDTQRVGYKVVVQAHQTDGTWAGILGTPIQRGKATDVTPAPIPPFGGGGIGGPNVDGVRTFVTLFWYRPDGTIEGKLKFRVQWYLRDNEPWKGNCTYL